MPSPTRGRKKAQGDPAIGARIRQLRNERGWQQPDVAEKLGVSRVTIGRWERGNQKIPVARLRELADLFGVSTGKLLGEETRQPEPALAPSESIVGRVAVWLAYTESSIGRLNPVLDSLEGAVAMFHKSIVAFRTTIGMMREDAAIARRTLNKHPEMHQEQGTRADAHELERMVDAFQRVMPMLEEAQEAPEGEEQTGA